MTDASFKKTDIEWLPEVPTGWDVRRIKTFYREIDDRSTDGSEELLSVSQYTGITPRRESLEKEDDLLTNAESLEGYKRVKKGDLVINIMLAWNGSLGTSQFDGIVSPAYCVYRCSENCDPEYFGLLFRTKLFTTEFKRHSLGIIESRLRMYSDRFFSIFSLVPPLPTQKKIVAHLDAKTAQIRHFLEKKAAFVALLKEQRQAIINDAVTRGIEPGARMKESGVAWLGVVPENWEVRRLGTIGSFSKGGNISRADLLFEEEGLPAILYGDIYTKYEFEAKTIINQISEATAQNAVSVKKGDLLLTGSGETKEDIGKCVVCASDETVFVGGDVIIFKQEVADSHFLSYALSSYSAIYQKVISAKGDIIVHIYGSKLRDLKLPFPPPEEQKKIAEFIRRETEKIDLALEKAQREMDLMREYCEALIAEAVMGRLGINN